MASRGTFSGLYSEKIVKSLNTLKRSNRYREYLSEIAIFVSIRCDFLTKSMHDAAGEIRAKFGDIKCRNLKGIAQSESIVVEKMVPDLRPANSQKGPELLPAFARRDRARPCDHC